MTDNPGSKHGLDEPAIENRASAVARFCGDIVSRMHLDLDVDVSEEGETLLVNLSGPDRPLLLSNGASLLNSLEYLVNKVFRLGRTEIPSIVVDSNKYRQHREAELVLLAQMASRKVIEQQRPLSLQPMIPRERRIVHLAVAVIDGVRSESAGAGEDRSITIYPD